MGGVGEKILMRRNQNTNGSIGNTDAGPLYATTNAPRRRAHPYDAALSRTTLFYV